MVVLMKEYRILKRTKQITGSWTEPSEPQHYCLPDNSFPPVRQKEGWPVGKPIYPVDEDQRFLMLVLFSLCRKSEIC